MNNLPAAICVKLKIHHATHSHVSELSLLRAFILVVCVACIAFVVNAKEVMIEQWQEPYKTYIKDIPKHPDSVMQALLASAPPKEVSNSVKAQYYSTLSLAYFALSYPNEALSNAQVALTWVDAQSFPWLYHNIKLAESQAFDIVGKPNAGLKGTNAAIVWAELNDDKELLTNALYVRGALLNSLLDYKGALRDLQRAYDLAPSEGGVLSKGNIASMLALVYEYRKDDALAIPFFEESVAYNRANENFLELSISLYGLGKANRNIGHLALGQSQLSESKQWAEKVGDEQGVAYALKELAGIEISQGNFERANTMLKEALVSSSDHRNTFFNHV